MKDITDWSRERGGDEGAEGKESNRLGLGIKTYLRGV